MVERGGKNGASFNKKYKYQDEILFHRNMQYKIDKVEEVNGVYYLYGRVLADEWNRI